MSDRLTDGEQALIRQIAQEVAKEVASEMCKRIDQALRLHQAECPGAILPGQLKLLVVGVAFGSAALSAGGVVGILRLLGG